MVFVVFSFWFVFIVPRTELIGDSDRYVKAGSTVNLRCIVRGAIEPPLYIIWYHGAQQILPDNKFGYRMELVKNDENELNAMDSSIMTDRKNTVNACTFMN